MLATLDVAKLHEELRDPARNQMKALGGNRAVRHFVRINDQWCIRCAWIEDGPENVENVVCH